MISVDGPEAVLTTERLSRELELRRPEMKRRIDYFKGNTGQLRFASKKFGEYFDKQFEGFSDNWCMPVAQATAERINFLGIRPYGQVEGVDSELQRHWFANDADAGSSEMNLLFGVASRGFSLTHPDKGPGGTPRLTWEHPDSAIVDTDPATQMDRSGLVVWQDDKRDYATLYTPDKVFKYKRKTGQDRYERGGLRTDLTGGWELRDDRVEWEVNPLGEVPLTEFRNQTLLDDEPLSDISGVMSLQDAINLVWAYLLNTLDQASLPARIVSGADLPKVPKRNSAGEVIGYVDVELDELMKERILWLPKDAKADEWTAAQLNVFSDVIERIVEHIAAQTRTPPHYLVAKMINTAAESLNIAEAGLVSKVQERIKYMSRGMRKTQRLMAKAGGADQKRLDAINAGRLIYSNVQYRSESQMADVAVKMKSSGFPTEYIVERLVVEPDEVRRIMKMIESEQARDPLLAAQNAMRAGYPSGVGS